MNSTYTALPVSSSIELQPKYPTLPQDPPKKHEQFGVELPLILDAVGAGYGPAAAGSGVPGAIFNLATSIIGAGIMALPATLKVLGLLVGFVSIVLMGILSEISIELLVRFSVLSKSSSYGDVVQTALGRPFKIVSEICVIINNAGVLVVYLIIIAPRSTSASSINCSGIDSLSLTSAASVALAVVFVIVSSIIALVKLVEGRIGTPRLGPDFGSKAAILDLLVVVPIMTNAYVCHFNVQPIYNELEGENAKEDVPCL
ncbi:hypothetical protein GW17_00011538 [Ensete ventricosum]|nr:hypothetical protein GW17_00011538 [Ensete ventricosum]